MSLSANQDSGKLPIFPKENPIEAVDAEGRVIQARWTKALYNWFTHIKPAITSVTPQPPGPAVIPPFISAEGIIGEVLSRLTSPAGVLSHPSIQSLIQSLAPPPARSSIDQTARDLAYSAASRVILPPPVGQTQIIVCTQATFPTLASTSPAIIVVTDYAHTLYWDGTNCNFIDGGNRFIALFDVDPTSDATRPGWHLLDGTANIHYLNSDGTLGTYTVEDATTAFFLEAGLANSGPTAAVAPVFTGTPATPAGTNSAPTFTGSAAAMTSQLFTTSAGTAALTTLDGSNTTFTPHGSVSAPVFTGTPATPAGTVDATGEPRKLVRRPFFRQ